MESVNIRPSSLERFAAGADDFMAHLVTMDGPWLNHYDFQTKQESMELRHSGSLRTKKFQPQKLSGKILSSMFCEKGRVHLMKYLLRNHVSVGRTTSL